MISLEVDVENPNVVLNYRRREQIEVEELANMSCNSIQTALSSKDGKTLRGKIDSGRAINIRVNKNGEQLEEQQFFDFSCDISSLFNN